MGKHLFRLLVLGMIGGFLAISLLVLTFRPEPEPVHNGKLLSTWVAALQSPGDPTAAEAIRQIGPKALPFLSTELQTREHYKQKAMDLFRYLKPSYQNVYQRTNLLGRKMWAAHAIGILGETAQPLRGKLQLRYEETGDYSIGLAYSALIFTNATTLLSGLTNADSNERNFALSHVWFFRQRDLLRASDETVFPVVTNLLSDPQSEKAFAAVLSFGTSATNAIPALNQLTNDADKVRRERALWTIRQIQLKASQQ